MRLHCFRFETALVVPLAFLLLLLSGSRGRAAPAPPDGGRNTFAEVELSPAEILADPALSQKIQVSSKRIYIGDLLEKLSKQTGVQLSAGEKDGAADVQIIAFLRDVPLANAMTALQSLMSYRGAPWVWKSVRASSLVNFGSKGTAYRFCQSESARLFPIRIRQQVQRDFEAEAAALTGALKLSPEKQQEAAKSNPDIHDLLEDGKRSELALETFTETLSPEMQASVLRGESQPRFDVGQLSDNGHAFVDFVVNEARRLNGNVAGPWNQEASSIKIVSTIADSCIAPVLVVGVGQLGGYAYVGGMPLERKCKAIMRSLWFLPGDAHAAEPDSQLLTAGRRDTSDEHRPETYESNVTRAFKEISDVTSTSLLVRMPTIRRHNLMSPDLPLVYGQTLQQLRTTFVEKRNLDSKWRDGVLLFNDMTWINKEGPPSSERVHDPYRNPMLNEPPWVPVREFRAAMAASPDGVPSLEALCNAARSMTVAQLKSLAESDDCAMLIGVADWRDLYATMGRLPKLAKQMQTPEGERIAAFQPEVLARYNIERLQDAGVHPAALRVRLEKYPYHGKTRGVVHIELLGSAGNTIEKSALSLDAIDIQERREREAKQRLGQSGPGTGS